MKTCRGVPDELLAECSQQDMSGILLRVQGLELGCMPAVFWRAFNAPVTRKLHIS